jgi:hypothetical protein
MEYISIYKGKVVTVSSTLAFAKDCASEGTEIIDVRELVKIALKKLSKEDIQKAVALKV